MGTAFVSEWANGAKNLRQFDAATIHLKTGIDLHQLPYLLEQEIDRISRFDYFEEQLEKFLRANGLPSLRTARRDGWLHFKQLYGKVVEDSPLKMNAQDQSATIARVTLTVESGKTTQEGWVWSKVTWTIQDKDERTGEIYVLDSFRATPRDDE